MNSKVFNGFPSSCVAYDKDFHDAIVVAEGALNRTKLLTFTDDKTNYEFITPTTGNYLVIRGISIQGTGNTGTVKFIRSSDGTCIFPAYFTAQVKGSPSSAYNLVLNPNEKVLITTTSRSGSETFAGITYLEFSPMYE